MAPSASVRFHSASLLSLSLSLSFPAYARYTLDRNPKSRDQAGMRKGFKQIYCGRELVLLPSPSPAGVHMLGDVQQKGGVKKDV